MMFINLIKQRKFIERHKHRDKSKVEGSVQALVFPAFLST